MGCYGFKFTLSSQPLTPSREGLFACAVWLTKHENDAPRFMWHACTALFSSGTFETLPGSSHLAFCIQYI